MRIFYKLHQIIPIILCAKQNTRLLYVYMFQTYVEILRDHTVCHALSCRSVMVDMEEKVIAQTLQSAKRSKQWRYPAKQQFCQKRGSGNNWAHGYSVHGPKVCDTLYLTVSFIVALACVECSTG